MMTSSNLQLLVFPPMFNHRNDLVKNHRREFLYCLSHFFYTPATCFFSDYMFCLFFFSVDELSLLSHKAIWATELHHIWPNQFYSGQCFPLCRIDILVFHSSSILGPNSLQLCPIYLYFLWQNSSSEDIYSLIVFFFLFPFETLQNTFANIHYIKLGHQLNSFCQIQWSTLLSIVFQPSVMFEFHSLLSQITPPLSPIQIIIQTFSWSLCSCHHPYGLCSSSLQLEESPWKCAEYIITLMSIFLLHTVKAHTLYKAYPLTLVPNTSLSLSL